MEDIQWLSDKMILEGIGKKLKEWRLEMDLSQAEMASKTDLSLTTYLHFEHGKGGSMANFLRVLRVLGRLDSLETFFQERPISPILAQKIERGMKLRQRATRNATKSTPTHD